MKISHVQKLWLADLANGLDPMRRKRGRSEHGGAFTVLRALIRNGYVDRAGKLTPAGQLAARPPACGQCSGSQYVQPVRRRVPGRATTYEGAVVCWCVNCREKARGDWKAAAWADVASAHPAEESPKS